MKVATGEIGLGMFRGEYHRVSASCKFIPDSFPRPVAWGTCKSDANTHFYLCEVMDMIDKLLCYAWETSLLGDVFTRSYMLLGDIARRYFFSDERHLEISLEISYSEIC